MYRLGAEKHYQMCGVEQTAVYRRREASRTLGRWTLVARKVAARLKPNSITEFTNLMECEILPWLRTQEGFLDLIILAVPDGREVATISFWDDKGNAQAYNTRGYPKALKILEKLLDGTPYIKTFDVVSSTFQGVTLARLAETDNLVQKTASE
jgi:heme-degrading monooxygenase HmoA